MKKLTKIIEISVEPSGKDLGECFSFLDSKEQAEFFNIIAETYISFNDGVGRFASQMSAVSREEILTKEARGIMSTIGECSIPY